jgi:hypothetical protein
MDEGRIISSAGPAEPATLFDRLVARSQAPMPEVGGVMGESTARWGEEEQEQVAPALRPVMPVRFEGESKAAPTKDTILPPVASRGKPEVNRSELAVEPGRETIREIQTVIEPRATRPPVVTAAPVVQWSLPRAEPASHVESPRHGAVAEVPFQPSTATEPERVVKLMTRDGVSAVQPDFPAPLPRPASTRAKEQAAVAKSRDAEPVINVTIGRVEVRAKPQGRMEKPGQRAKDLTGRTLEQYLAGRRGERRP